MTDLGTLVAALGKGSISRREFICASLAMGVAATSAVGMANRALAAPKQGGRLRQALGHGSTSDSLDPSTHGNGYMQNVTYSYCNHLTELDNDGVLKGELAESFEASKDAKVWTFKLRKGVEFHNGKTVTSDDVVTSFNHHRGQDSKSSAAALLEQLESISTDGADTVTFTLRGGNADWPYIVSDYHLAIHPSNGDKSDWQSGIGTGAYKIEYFEPGVRTLFSKNPNYFKDGRGHFNEVETISIIDTNARQNAITTGEVEVIDRVDLKTVALLSRKPNVNILETTGTLHYAFPMRTDIAPFDNLDVRMALKLSVDREQMVSKILKGHGAVGNDHPISPANRYHDENIPQRVYDPEKAKWHLRKAGAEGLTVPLSVADAAFNGAVDAGILYKEMASAAGINIDLIREPNDGYWANVWIKKPWCASFWGGRPTEDWMLSAAYWSEAKWNESVFHNKRLDELILSARAELDDAKRRVMYAEAQAIISNQGGTVVPMFSNYVNAVATTIAHDKVASNWQLDGNKNVERWWFA